MNVYAIARPAEGVTINGNEYVCNANNEIMLFYSAVEALAYLSTRGYYKAADIEREGIEIVEMQDCGDYYEPIKG